MGIWADLLLVPLEIIMGPAAPIVYPLHQQQRQQTAAIHPSFTLPLSLLQLLLSLARGLFTEQRNLQRLIFKIISEAKDLLR